MSSSTILNVMIYATISCFPLLMVITLAVVLAKKRGATFLQVNPDAKRAYERIVALGPKEGQSGYVIADLVFLWLAVMAALVFFSIQGGNPDAESFIDRRDMSRVEMEDGRCGYVSMTEIDDATRDLVQSGQVPGQVQIPAYSEDGEVIGEYTVSVTPAQLTPIIR